MNKLQLKEVKEIKGRPMTHTVKFGYTDMKSPASCFIDNNDKKSGNNTNLTISHIFLNSISLIMWRK